MSILHITHKQQSALVILLVLIVMVITNVLRSASRRKFYAPRQHDDVEGSDGEVLAVEPRRERPQEE